MFVLMALCFKLVELTLYLSVSETRRFIDSTVCALVKALLEVRSFQLESSCSRPAIDAVTDHRVNI